MEHQQYDEQFSHSELGRSGNEIVNINRDTREPHDPDPTHWDVTERNDSGEIERFHVMDDQQSWLQDF